jgi:hypothetical protein
MTDQQPEALRLAENLEANRCHRAAAELRRLHAENEALKREMDAQATDRVAQVIAELFDYPWDHMPEQGREDMRKKARAIFFAALAAQAKQGGA